MNNKLIQNLPAEIQSNIIANLDKATDRLMFLTSSKDSYHQLNPTLPRRGDAVFEAWLQERCQEMPSPRRAYAFYEKSGSEPMVLNGYKWLVAKDVPVKAIVTTLLATAAINLAVLSMHGQLIGTMESLLSTLSVAMNILPAASAGIIGGLNYFNLFNDKLSLLLAWGCISSIAFYFLAQVVPSVILAQLCKSSAYTAFYFLILHALTAGALITLNICKDPSKLFNALGLLIVGFCLFRNMANNL